MFKKLLYYDKLLLKIYSILSIIIVSAPHSHYNITNQNKKQITVKGRLIHTHARTQSLLL